MASQGWDRSVDILVVGTGNGGLTAAVCNYEMGTKDILVIDKADKVGAPARHRAAVFGCRAITMRKKRAPAIRLRRRVSIYDIRSRVRMCQKSSSRVISKWPEDAPILAR